jgi:hypothetical protein
MAPIEVTIIAFFLLMKASPLTNASMHIFLFGVKTRKDARKLRG